MWTMIPSLQACVDVLAPVFTAPTFASHCQLLLGWIMCLGDHTIKRVGRTAQADQIPDDSGRHGLDSYYNFFERASWVPAELGKRVAELILSRLCSGVVTVVVDDTLLHKSGPKVHGLGWFRDAVASTKKRVAVAPGNNWVVLSIVVFSPFTAAPVLALPVLARLHILGEGKPSCAQLAQQMLAEFRGWFPGLQIEVLADGAYACKETAGALPNEMEFTGRTRADAALYDPEITEQPKGKRGRKPTKGPRLPSPKEAAKRADRKRKDGPGGWQRVTVTLYGKTVTLLTISYTALWPRVMGSRPIQVVVVRDPSGAMQDCYLFTTDLTAGVRDVILKFSWRWSIEPAFRANKQEFDAEAPRHYAKGSIERLAPWLWCMQSVLSVWYLTEGWRLPEAEDLRKRMNKWDSPFSIRTMIRVLHSATLNALIKDDSSEEDELRKFVQTLKNWALLAA